LFLGGWEGGGNQKAGKPDGNVREETTLSVKARKGHGEKTSSHNCNMGKPLKMGDETITLAGGTKSARLGGGKKLDQGASTTWCGELEGRRSCEKPQARKIPVERGRVGLN